MGNECQILAKPVSVTQVAKHAEQVSSAPVARVITRERTPTRESTMSHDFLKRLGLDHLDAKSPDFLKTLQRMQREAWESLREETPRTEGSPSMQD